MERSHVEKGAPYVLLRWYLLQIFDWLMFTPSSTLECHNLSPVHMDDQSGLSSEPMKTAVEYGGAPQNYCVDLISGINLIANTNDVRCLLYRVESLSVR
jgi:hypothetical protein